MFHASRWPLAAVAGLVALFVGGGTALATGQAGISQYLWRTHADQELKIANPMPFDMFAIAIGYNDDGTFEQCRGWLIPPRMNVEDDEELDGDFAEVLAVPTEGKTGKIQKGIGVWARDGKITMNAGDAKAYKLSATKSVRDDVVDCVCSELANFALPEKLFKGFGFKC